MVAELHSAIERERATKQKRIEAKARLEVRTFPGAWRIGLVGAWCLCSWVWYRRYSWTLASLCFEMVEPHSGTREE